MHHALGEDRAAFRGGGGYCRGFTHGVAAHRRVAKKVVCLVAIWVDGVRVGFLFVCCLPGVVVGGVEDSAFRRPYARQKRKVVMVVFGQGVAKMTPSESEHMHVLRVWESHLAELGIGDYVHAVSRSLDFHPFPLRHHRIGHVVLRRQCRGVDCRQCRRGYCRSNYCLS